MKIIHFVLAVFMFSVYSNLVSAYDIGPFTIKGFALGELSYATNQCPDCQVHPDEDRQRNWADDINPNKEFKPLTVTFSLFQPYLEFRPYNLGKGFKVGALLSQRWRDGNVDIQGIWYEKNLTLSHEYYGSIQIGAYPTRGWGVADYPYGTLLGVADPWGASGSGYGLLTNAVRVTSPAISFFKGDLLLEVTYDSGDSNYDQNQQFLEYYAQFVRGRLIIDFIHQNAKNGKPGSWTHSPFLGLTDESKYENVYESTEKIPENRQKIWLLMGRYTLFNKYEFMGGIRRNFWSGARAVIVGKNEKGQFLWNNMFNVDWDGKLNGEDNPGYPARSQDLLLGARYFYTQELIFSSSMVHLGEAETENPEERGQSNALTMNTLGAAYLGLYPGLEISAGFGYSQYKHKGLAPLSMPSHSAFSGVDSRIKTYGTSYSVTAIYNF